MKMINQQFIVKPLVVAISALLLSGCGGGGDSSTTATKTTTVQMSGAVVDGYLVNSIAFLDLNKNGYWDSSSEPASSTGTDGSYSFSVTADQQANPNFATAPIVVVDGYDSDTGKRYAGKLFSPQTLSSSSETSTTTTISKSVTLNVSALTTLVEKTGNVDKVKQVLGLTSTDDLKANPLALAKNATTDAEKTLAKKLVAQNIALNRAVEVLVAASGSSDSSGTANTVYDKLKTVIDSKTSATSIANIVDGLSAVTGVPGSSAIGAAKVTADKTTTLLTDVALDITQASAVQEAAIKSSAVVAAVAGATDATTATTAADSALTNFSLQLTYIKDQKVDLVGVSSADLATFSGLSVAITDISGKTPVLALTYLKDLTGVPTSIKTAIGNRISQLTATDTLVSFLKTNGIDVSTFSSADSSAFYALDFTSLGSSYTLDQVKAFSGMPTNIVTAITKAQASAAVIAAIKASGITLTTAQEDAVKKLDATTLSGDYSLTAISGFFANNTTLADLKTAIDTKIQDLANLAKLQAVTGDYWVLDMDTQLSGSTTDGTSSFSIGGAVQPGLATVSLDTNNALNVSSMDPAYININQFLNPNNGAPTLTLSRNIDAASTTAKKFSITLNADNSISTSQDPKVGDTGQDTWGGNTYTYTYSYVLNTGMIPVYKDSVTNRYVYVGLRDIAKQYGADNNNRLQMSTALTTLIPKASSYTNGTLANVKGHTYGGVILQTQYPNGKNTSVALDPAQSVANLVWETSRWTIDTSGNVTRPLTDQNVAKLKYVPNGIKLGFDGADYQIKTATASTRINRTATSVDHSNGTVTATWGEGDGSTRMAAYSPDGMVMMLNKHHTSFDSQNPAAVFDCASTTDVLDTNLQNCQIGERLGVKLPNTGDNATITNNLNGKTYRFIGLQVQGNTKGSLVEQAAFVVNVAFALDVNNHMKFTITPTKGASNSLHYNSSTPAAVSQVTAADVTSLSPISFDETANSVAYAATRLGEFELALVNSGDPMLLSGSVLQDGTHIKLFTSQDGADADNLPDLMLGVAYAQDANSSDSTQKDRSLWLLIGSPVQ